ncbi:Rrf2 family transcriptional regulator [Shimazuella sp. AN120528]|uniref:Rrf2 family transcriptional regulator n=1 Tax=Shimazuella soli TaxID=1892854 RepID=UPI001F0E3F2C|nr:Rrf2 family transcriptional regulator [Shimazuella soli]MCH5585552.1 Rrf2 family transcriptional regulator [Shimazuella soli]
MSNSHFTIALHILARMALVAEKNKVITSKEIATSVNTNPVFIRRILSLLEKSNLVVVQYGTGSGWKLARNPDNITLSEVYQAIKQKPIFGLHRSIPNQNCPIGKGIQPVLKYYYSDVEKALHSKLAKTTVADLLGETLTLSSQELHS